MADFKWKVSKNTDFYQVWRQTRPLRNGEPMHSGVREYAEGIFGSRQAAQKYADMLNEEESGEKHENCD